MLRLVVLQIVDHYGGGLLQLILAHEGFHDLGRKRKKYLLNCLVLYLKSNFYIHVDTVLIERSKKK
jgi:hypothetical protein